MRWRSCIFLSAAPSSVGMLRTVHVRAVTVSTEQGDTVAHRTGKLTRKTAKYETSVGYADQNGCAIEVAAFSPCAKANFKITVGPNRQNMPPARLLLPI